MNSAENLPQEEIPEIPPAESGLKVLWAASGLKAWHLLGGALVCVLLLWLAFRDASLTALSARFEQINWLLVGVVAGFSILGTIFRGWRWHLLYKAEGQEVSILWASRVLFISQTFNILIPARLGEVTRLILMAPLRAGITAGTVAVEKLLDIVTLAAFLLIMPFALSLPSWFNSAGQSFLGAALGLMALAAVLFFSRKPLRAWLSGLSKHLREPWGTWVGHFVRDALQGLEVIRTPGQLLGLGALSFAIWGLGALQNLVAFRSAGLTAGFTAAVFLLLVLQIGIAVPSVPGKVGVFQYLCILALGVFGIPREPALVFSLTLYLASFGPLIILGAIFGIWEWTSRRRKHRQKAESLPAGGEGGV